MIQLAARKEVLNDCPALARYMHDWQQAEYEDIQDSGSADEILAMQAEMDEIDTSSNTHHQLGELVYNMDAENIYEYIQKLTDAIFQLSALCKWEQLSFLLLYKKSWMLQRNEYPPVKAELKYLSSLGITNDSTDGITASGIDIPRSLRSIFWLSRCNGALPYIHFSAKGSDAVMYICKNGFLHFYNYDPAEQQRIQNACTEVGLNLFEGQVYDFLEGGAIIGRQLA